MSECEQEQVIRYLSYEWSHRGIRHAEIEGSHILIECEARNTEQYFDRAYDHIVIEFSIDSGNFWLQGYTEGGDAEMIYSETWR